MVNSILFKEVVSSVFCARPKSPSYKMIATQQKVDAATGSVLTKSCSEAVSNCIASGGIDFSKASSAPSLSPQLVETIEPEQLSQSVYKSWEYPGASARFVLTSGSFDFFESLETSNSCILCVEFQSLNPSESLIQSFLIEGSSSNQLFVTITVADENRAAFDKYLAFHDISHNHEDYVIDEPVDVQFLASMLTENNRFSPEHALRVYRLLFPGRIIWN